MSDLAKDALQHFVGKDVKLLTKDSDDFGLPGKFIECNYAFVVLEIETKSHAVSTRDILEIKEV